MKPFLRLLIVAASVFSVVILAGASPTNTNAPQYRLTVELRDGSRVVGQCVEKNFKFRSALLGELKLDVKDLRWVECVSSNSAKLATANGDTLTVWFVDSEFAVKTSFGKVELPVDSVRKFTVSASGKSGLRHEGLVALWSGDDNGKDSIGKNDAIQTSGVTFAPGKFGLGFVFDGSPNQMMVPSAPELNFGAGQDFSIEAWIMPQQAPENFPANEMTIVYKRFAPNRYNYIGYAFYLADGGQLYFLMGDAPMKTGGLTVNAGPDLRDGKFHHVAVTIQRDLPDGGHLYVDGESMLTFDPTHQGGSLANNEPFHIGNQNTPGYVTPFKGMIDELSLHNRALSASEIREDYEAGKAY